MPPSSFASTRRPAPSTRLAGAGQVSPDFITGLEVAVGRSASGLAVAEGRPAWSANLHDDPRVRLPDNVKQRMRQEDLRCVLAVPLWSEAIADFTRERFEGPPLLAAHGVRSAIGVPSSVSESNPWASSQLTTAPLVASVMRRAAC
jgi:hypothetical protein